ncbi:biotin-dependent carboxyltransferase family protein [Salinicoccus carnicancri]|uniref:5-oxoprolinase subunit C family protein n=1 Tax=Salinicoccus carnicancri TaxID=558170 RepID=UPI00030BCD9E|nr:biotin-dependent carboxyltransferase family protein [Salinicoccus carnicancri]
MMALKVMDPGLFTTVQDMGRYGHQAEGFSPAGAMDWRAMMLSNRLLGNDEGAAVLEMTLQGASFEVTEEVTISTAGAEMPVAVDGLEMKTGTVIPLMKGEQVSFGGAERGARTYLAVTGGFAVPEVFGSASTHTRSGIGGLGGRTLKSGDSLKAAGGNGAAGMGRIRVFDDDDDVIRVIPGQQYDRFKDNLDKFYGSGYTLTKDCDRMGFRLDGEVIEAVGGHDILSEPTQLGSIQIPKNGKPIILLNDRQTAGGYARIATVALCDIPKLVQKRQGDTIRFEEISVDRAVELYKDEIGKVRSDGYFGIDNDFRSHRRPLAGKIESIMKR